MNDTKENTGGDLLADIKNIVMCMTPEEARALLDECKKLHLNSIPKQEFSAKLF